MIKVRWRATILVICCLEQSSAILPLAYATDKQEIVSQARQSYYNLASAGLKEFRCDVEPDWDSAFQAMKADPVGRDQVLPILRKTHFELLVGPNGASTISRQSELAPPDEQVADRVRKASGGMEQILTGFLQIWSQFTINTTPLPDTGSDFQLDDLGDRYRITTKEASTEASILMSRDFQIEEMKASTPEFSGTVRPRFIRIKNLSILSSYDGVYRAGSGDAQELAVEIEYGDVQGLALPSKVTATMKLPSGAVAFALTFKNCRVKKR